MAGQQERFGQRLRLYREAAGYSQEELAERAGLSANAISALERGERKRPYPDTLRRLAEALGLSDAARSELAAVLRVRVEGTSVPIPEPGIVPRATVELPGEPTPLIGREREAEVVRHLLAHTGRHLLTLTGPGGVGKTRLALHVARSINDQYPDGVVWVELAPLGDPALVLSTIARALGLEKSLAGDVNDALRSWLHGRRILLVLDNFEHVLDAATDIAELLLACPDLHIVATSRAPLNIRGEQEYIVPPLELPLAGVVRDREDVAAISSVQLFVWQARQIHPAFELTEENAAIVATICRRLDGLPLALELVAARVRVLSPAELLARLDHLLPLLVGGSRDLPARQQTMRAAITWSYELLSPVEQALFRRLSVFAGGWTLEAAETAAAWGVIAVENVIDLLSRLVEQSLVVAEVSPEGGSRYRMLEPIRQFAAHRVEEAGEKMVLLDHHFAWCLSLAQRAERELVGPAQQEWLDRLEQEHDNLRVALAWSQRDDQPGTPQLQLATALWRFWATRGHLSEGRRWLEGALSTRDDVPAALRAHGLNNAGNLASDQGDFAQAAELIGASLDLRQELGDVDGTARSLNDLGNIRLNQGEYQRATQLYEEALSRFRELKTEWGTAIALQNIGIVSGFRGDYGRAVSALEEALVLWGRLGDTVGRARSLDALGAVARMQGDLTRAGMLHEESLVLRRALGDTRGLAVTLKNFGEVVRHRGDLTEASRLIEESLRLRRIIGDKLGIARSLSALADVARDQGDADRAEALYREAIAMRRQLETREGLADCLLGLAAILSADNHPARAARLLGASEALREAENPALPPVDRADFERTVAAIQGSLGPVEFDLARAAGRAMTMEQVIAEVMASDEGAAHSATSPSAGPAAGDIKISPAV